MSLDLGPLFYPQKVAVVGSSPVSVQGRFDYLAWLINAGFPGEIFPVNPRYQEVGGYRCYPSLGDIPGEVDLAIMMVPAERVVEVLRDTPAGKVRFVVAVTSGFGEVGKSDLESELVEVARARGMRVIGPNCMGVYSRKSRLPQITDQTFGSDPGEIAVLGQSGGHAINLVRSSMESGVTVNCSVSIGNQCDLCMEDFFEWFSGDDNIKLITAYVEDFKQGRRFPDMAREITLRKPIILWKGGTTQQGSQATASHTGALAVPNEIWEGMVRQSGAIPADNMFEIINFSRALLWETLPRGPGVCHITPGGGNSVHMTDCSVRTGLDVPLFSSATREKLSGFIADVNTIITNPIDLGAASYRPQILMDTISTVAREEAIHSFVIYHLTIPFKMKKLREMSKEFLRTIKKVRSTIDKPIYVALFSPYRDFAEADEARREVIGLLKELKIPYTIDLESCVKTVKRMWDYARYLEGRKAESKIEKGPLTSRQSV